MLMDREFEYLKDNIEISINTTAADENLTGIERRNNVFNGGSDTWGPVPLPFSSCRNWIFNSKLERVLLLQIM